MTNVIGMFDDRDGAEAAIERLRAFGVGNESISVVVKGAEPDEAEDMTQQGAAVGALSGAAVGTVVGLLVAGSTFVLPGVGPFLIAGPMFAALTGAGVGAASGGLLGALIGTGVPETEAAHYLAGVKGGKVVVAAHVEEFNANEVHRIFDEEGSIRTHTVR